VIHRDIKCGNVLLFNAGDPANVSAKIADFGSAVLKQRELQTVPRWGGTLEHTPPEARPGMILWHACLIMVYL
jgi:serine/threonine protein kinase